MSVVWDLVAEIGLYKLRGHKNQITGLHFLHSNSLQEKIRDDANGEAPADTNDYIQSEDESSSFLITTSKDALIKIWDLRSQHCMETHVAQSNGECWSMGLSPNGELCITAGNDGELKVWAIDIKGLTSFSALGDDDAEKRYLHERGVLYRQGKDRTLGVTFHARDPYLAVYGSEKLLSCGEFDRKARYKNSWQGKGGDDERKLYW